VLGVRLCPYSPVDIGVLILLCDFAEATKVCVFVYVYMCVLHSLLSYHALRCLAIPSHPRFVFVLDDDLVMG
jgi:hypothetical protein